MASLLNFSGIASGIDSSALIKALLDQERKTRITPLETKVTSLTDTNDSLSKLSELLGNLKSSADTFRLINGGALSKLATTSDETRLTASVSNSATNGSYNLSVTQLARNATSSFNDRFATSSTAINSSINDGAAAVDRTVSITIGNGAEAETVDVVLTSSTTADQFVQSFNSASENAEAALVNVGTTSAPSYAIVINSSSEGLDAGELSINVGTEIQSAGSGALTATSITQAQNAQFTVAGISGTITRQTNTISDVLSGITFSLKATGTSTINVSDDVEETASSVQDFVDAYNELAAYLKEQDLVTREEDGNETTNIFNPLANTSIDENILSALRSAFSSSANSSGQVRILADLGITTQRDGTLSFDSDIFKDAVADDSNGAKSLLETLGNNLSAVDGTIAQFTRFNGIIDAQKNSNSSLISSYNSRITEVESSLSKQEDMLIARYSRLEAMIGKLNSQQSALASLIPS